MIRICILLFVAISLFSCNSKDEIPATILKPSKMQAVLWDVIKAQAFTDQFVKKDTSKNAAIKNLELQQEIFDLHHVTKDEFYKSYDYYKNNAGLLNRVLDSIIEQNERNKQIKIKPFMAE